MVTWDKQRPAWYKTRLEQMQECKEKENFHRAAVQKSLSGEKRKAEGL
jgi:hypothetical protein